MLTFHIYAHGELEFESVLYPVANRAYRALAMHVFCATITLVMEASGTEQPTDELLDCVKSGLNFLDQVQSDNMVAKAGLTIVQRLARQYDVITSSDDST